MPKSLLACLRLGAAVLTVALAGPTLAADTDYKVRSFAAPGADSTFFWDINDRGQVAGYADFVGVSRAFVYDGATLRYLDGPAGSSGAIATGISNDGLIVGTSYDADGGASGYLFDGVSYTALEVPGALGTSVRHVSPDGRYVTGTFETAQSAFLGFVLDRQLDRYSFVGTADDITVVQGVTNAGVAVGSINPSRSGTRGFIFDVASAEFDFPVVDAFVPGRLRDINEAGTIVGFGGPAGNGFVYRDGEVQASFALGSGGTLLYGINGFDQVVGHYAVGAGDRYVAFLASPVPEPQAGLLLLIGLGALALARRAPRSSPSAA